MLHLLTLTDDLVEAYRCSGGTRGSNINVRVMPAAVTCDAPALIQHGSSNLSSPTITSGSSVTFSCNDGYVLVGLRSLTCTAEGTFDGRPPRCEGKGSCDALTSKAAWIQSRDDLVTRPVCCLRHRHSTSLRPPPNSRSDLVN